MGDQAKSFPDTVLDQLNVQGRLKTLYLRTKEQRGFPKFDKDRRLRFKHPLAQVLFDASRLMEAMENHRDTELIETYLYKNPPLHPRRTLDQAYYCSIRNTKVRDRDQVVYRGTSPKEDGFHQWEYDDDRKVRFTCQMHKGRTTQQFSGRREAFDDVEFYKPPHKRRARWRCRSCFSAKVHEVTWYGKKKCPDDGAETSEDEDFETWHLETWKKSGRMVEDPGQDQEKPPNTKDANAGSGQDQGKPSNTEDANGGSSSSISGRPTSSSGQGQSNPADNTGSGSLQTDATPPMAGDDAGICSVCGGKTCSRKSKVITSSKKSQKTAKDLWKEIKVPIGGRCGACNSAACRCASTRCKHFEPNNTSKEPTEDTPSSSTPTTGPKSPHEKHKLQRCQSCRENICKLSRLVMVDQLWMWILDKDTILTFFPRRYGFNRKDASGVHKAITRRLADNSKGISTVFDLAIVILSECTQVFFNRAQSVDRQPKVLDLFSEAIGRVVSCRAKLVP